VTDGESGEYDNEDVYLIQSVKWVERKGDRSICKMLAKWVKKLIFGSSYKFLFNAFVDLSQSRYFRTDSI